MSSVPLSITKDHTAGLAARRCLAAARSVARYADAPDCPPPQKTAIIALAYQFFDALYEGENPSHGVPAHAKAPRRAALRKPK